MKLIKKALAASLIVMLSLFITLSFLELTVRIFHKFKSSPRGRANLPISKTYRLSENRHLLYELLPHSRAKIQGKEFVINEFGFRDKNYSKRKTKGLRIICVGDSITYGWRVRLKKTYHKQLEKLFSKKGQEVAVMGMGVPGYNTVQEYYLVEEKALDFNPDILILQICPNDFERTVGIKEFREGKRLTLIPYHDYSIPFIIKKTKFTYFLMHNSHLFKFINFKLHQALNNGKSKPGQTPQDVYLMGEEKSFRYLRKIKTLLDSHNVRFAAVVFPFQSRGDVYSFASLHKRIHSELERMEVPYIDLFDELNATQVEDIWFERLHPNVRGYAIASRALFRFLEPLLYDN